MKKYIYLCLLLFISLIVSINSLDVFITNTEQIIQILLNLIAISLASYTFLFSPLSILINKKNSVKLKGLLDKLLNEFEINIKIIFLSLVVIIFFNIFENLNIPFFKDPKNIDFGLFCINSLKETICNLIISFCTLVSIYSFYDISKATFLILRGTLENM